ncbi:MAG: aminotransferase class I/II-fold pyridoxal phosphate-dependent enzyme [Gemmatimonadetes bacterium]|nr:aminotransferase class I/II-fold pyridoxal phosphate-dependent enzyme [Gemmatimonadota bacterium]
MAPERSRRFQNLPRYPMVGVPEAKARLEAAGVDVIDLGAGDADLDPPPEAVRRLAEAASQRSMSRYPFQSGLPDLREAIATWMGQRFGVSLDPYTEILPLMGSKEGIAKLPLAFLDPGDAAVIPDPGYQAYQGGVILAGGEPYLVPLRPENDYLIPLDGIPDEVRSRLRLMYLNYPNNPTTATAPLEYLEDTVSFCREHDAVLVYDHAYSEIAFDGYRPPSILEVEGADGIALEFHSFSKTYNMTGWRLGWVAGNADLIESLTLVKTVMDIGVFKAVQAAGAAALAAYEHWVPGNVARFQVRRDVAVEGLRQAGFTVTEPKATMYLWVPVPGGGSSLAFAERALQEAGVVVLPGAALGAGGEGYFRIALTVEEERMRAAVARLGKLAVE